jgi:hypothetical protein
MRQRLVLIAIKKDDVARCGLPLAQLQTQANPIDLAGNLPPFQRVPRPPVTELFFATPWTAATADAHALACFDLGTHARDRPVRPVGDWLLQ